MSQNKTAYGIFTRNRIQIQQGSCELKDYHQRLGELVARECGFEQGDSVNTFKNVATQSDSERNLSSSSSRERGWNRFRAAAIFALLVLGCFLCSPASSENRVSSVNNRAYADDYKSDNTGKNIRDRDSGHLKTADQQALSGEQNAVLARVRNAVVRNEGLSTNGKNIKIIAEGKTLFLRGPVASLDEKNWIEKTALEAAQGYSVINQLETDSGQVK